MSNTLNLMYQQILLNYLYVVEVCARVCLCGGTLNGVHMSVYVQLSEHTQACWCLHVRGGERVFRHGTVKSTRDEVTHPATHHGGMRKLAFKSNNWIIASCDHANYNESKLTIFQLLFYADSVPL